MKKNRIPQPIFHVLALPILPVLALLLIISWIFRQGVRLWLHLKLGHQFGGLLSGADKVYLPRNGTNRKLVVDVNYFISDHKVDVSAILKRNLQEKVFSHADLYPKLTGTCHSFLGHNYLVKNCLSIDDIVKTIPLPTNSSVSYDEDYLKRFVGPLTYNPLPKNDTALWYMYVSAEPLASVKTDIKGYIYPVVLIGHHAVADGVRYIRMLSILFDAQMVENYYEGITAKNGPKSIQIQLIKLTQQILYQLYLIVTGIVTYLNLTFLREHDKNDFKKPLMGENVIAWAIDTNGSRVKMVKTIKNKIPNTKFSDVLFSCISASIFNFFKKKNWEVPESISCILPILLNFSSFDKTKAIDLRNDFTMAMAKVPVVDPDNFFEGLEKTKISMNQMRGSSEKDLIYLLLNHLLAPVPGPIIQFMENTRSYTCLISSLPGTGSLNLPGNHELMYLGTAPHSSHTGVTITIVTYDNKFHICLLVDKGIIPNQEDAQSIVDDILRNIDLLYEETIRTYS